MPRFRWFQAGCCWSIALTFAIPGSAQTPSLELLPLPPELSPPPSLPFNTAPPLTLTVPPSPTVTSAEGVRFQLREVEVQGSTVLQAEIAALIAPLRDQPVSFEDLVKLRVAITQLYIDNGYVTSGAFLPDNQDLSSGIVRIQVIEGQLEQIQIMGLQRLRSTCVRDRLELAPDTPLNQQALVEALQLLQLDPLIRQVDAELVAVQEADPFSLSVVGYSRDSGRVVAENFAKLGIRRNSETFSIAFRQSVERSPQTEFALGLGLDLHRSQTFIFEDQPYPFSSGAENGESNLIVLRFSQEWVDRNATRVLAAQSQFSLGLNAFDASVDERGADGEFFTWLGQFQYVQQVFPWLLLVSRVAAMPKISR